MKSNKEIQDIQDILLLLDADYQCSLQPQLADAAEGSGYWEQIDIIRPLFSDAQPFTQGSILLRLTILDSLYSTNGRYAQFDLETIAREFYAFASDRKLVDYFQGIVRGSTDTQTFFTKKYGLNKNLTEGPSFMSLVSKYAFYLLAHYPQAYPLGFPIYDSLALATYPLTCKIIGLSPRPQSGAKHNIKEHIEAYVQALDELRGHLFKGMSTQTQQFILLDAYLWRIGKINQGSITLLLDRPDFERFITNMGMEGYVKPRGAGSLSFDEALLKACKEIPCETALKGIGSCTFKALFKHWKKYYAASLITKKNGN